MTGPLCAWNPWILLWTCGECWNLEYWRKPRNLEMLKFESWRQSWIWSWTCRECWNLESWILKQILKSWHVQPWILKPILKNSRFQEILNSGQGFKISRAQRFRFYFTICKNSKLQGSLKDTHKDTDDFKTSSFQMLIHTPSRLKPWNLDSFGNVEILHLESWRKSWNFDMLNLDVWS